MSRYEPVYSEELLTSEELDALALVGELARALGRIVGEGSSRSADLRELVAHVHAIQQAIMSQAAARALPDRFRLLGGYAPTTSLD